MLELKIRTDSRRYVAPEGLRAALGAERAREKLADAIEALMAQLDMIDGDPDLEDDRSDFELTGDEKGDPSYCEWHTLPGATRKSGKLNSKPVDSWRGMILEDEEEDDAPEEDDPLESNGDDQDTCDGEDEIFSVRATRWLIDRPGCEVSDPGEYDGGEHRLQCGDVRSLELNDN